MSKPQRTYIRRNQATISGVSGLSLSGLLSAVGASPVVITWVSFGFAALTIAIRWIDQNGGIKGVLNRVWLGNGTR